MQTPASHADPALVEAWLRTRSVARGLPQPVYDHGGLRVDTNSPGERRRYVFAEPAAGLLALAQAIHEPLVFLKLCGSRHELSELLPRRWRVESSTSMMVAATSESSPRVDLPAGYRLELSKTGPISQARVITSEGVLAASGYAAEAHGAFVYDRIVTEPLFRRKGLGSSVMGALGAARRSTSAVQVLVATADGRALYSKLGWVVHSPYSTAVLPAAE